VSGYSMLGNCGMVAVVPSPAETATRVVLNRSADGLDQGGAGASVGEELGFDLDIEVEPGAGRIGLITVHDEARSGIVVVGRRQRLELVMIRKGVGVAGDLLAGNRHRGEQLAGGLR
jgi:hypothetical protein